MDNAVSLRKFVAETRLLETEASAYVATKGWKIASAAYPTLGVVLRHSRSERELEFRFRCDDWDEEPPSLALHDPRDGRELLPTEWPRGNGWHHKHPTSGKPFLCLPGIREYHTHRSHVRDRWDGYRLRGTYRLRDIVDRVHQKFELSSG